jgi:hypothetical protein
VFVGGKQYIKMRSWKKAHEQNVAKVKKVLNLP